MKTKKLQRTELQFPVQSNEPSLGSNSAPYQLVMYGDYEDVDTKKVFIEIQQFLQQNPEKVHFIWRHFPLSRVHQKSQKAAEVTLAALEKQKFWEMHKLLIAQNSKLDFTDLIANAKEIGIYSPQLYNALLNNKYAWDVRESMRKGATMGIKKLPALFLNGILLNVELTQSNLKKLIA